MALGNNTTQEGTSLPVEPSPPSKLTVTKYQLVMVLVMGVYLFYLTYRVLFTLNPNAYGFSLLFLYAEVHGFIAIGLYFFQLWNPTVRIPPTPVPNLSVDIFIPTYNEDLALLRKTANSCLTLTYQAKVFFLDDGNRLELAQMAKELGCGYIARDKHTQAKAGNLNHALSLTNGEFIAVFDADYVPYPTFLERTLGYFQDPEVAFVQTPHNYYNVDSFQFWINSKKRDKWNEQDAFYRLIMPGRDSWNASFFAGTSAVIRRTALEEIGGFAADTITEDVETSIRLYSKGWHGRYHNEVLSNGLAANDLSSYHQQKLRWAEGNINLLFSENPLTKKGLTWPQRLCFLATIFGWFVGIPEAIYFITPPIMLFTDWYPIEPFDMQFLLVYLVFLSVLLGGFTIVSRGYGRIGFNSLYNMMNFFVLLKAIVKSLLQYKSRFVVTSKESGKEIRLRTLAPQIFISLLCLGGMMWGTLKLHYGFTTDYLIYSIGIFWAGVNGVLAGLVIHKTSAAAANRTSFRFIGAIPVRWDNSEGTHLGVSKDLNDGGLALETFEQLTINDEIRLVLYLGPQRVQIRGKVLYQQPMNNAPSLPAPMRHYGVQFMGTTPAERDSINQYCFDLVLPKYFHYYAKRRSWGQMLTNWMGRRRSYQQRQFRQQMTLPCHVSGPSSFYSVVNDISSTGVAFTSHQPLKVGQQLDIDIYSPEAVVSMAIEIRSLQKITPGYTYIVGAKFLAPISKVHHPLTPFMNERAAA